MVFRIAVLKKFVISLESTWNGVLFQRYSLHKKCPYLEFHWSIFSCIRTENGVFKVNYKVNAKIYKVNLRIQSKCGKMQTRETPNMDIFYKMIDFLTLKHAENMLEAWKLTWKQKRHHKPDACSKHRQTSKMSNFCKHS